MTKATQQRHPDCPPCPPCPQPPDPPAGGQNYPSTPQEYSDWLTEYCEKGNDVRLRPIAVDIFKRGGLTNVAECVEYSEAAFTTSRDPRVRAVGDAVAQNVITTISDLMRFAEAAVGGTGDTMHRAMGKDLGGTKLLTLG